MRGLELRDVVAMSRMIAEMDIKEDVKKTVVDLYDFNQKKHSEAESKAAQVRFGVDILWIIMAGASKKRIESQLYEFIATVIDVPATEVAKMSPDVLLTTIKENVEVKEFTNFFKSAVRSMMQS